MTCAFRAAEDQRPMRKRQPRFSVPRRVERRRRRGVQRDAAPMHADFDAGMQRAGWRNRCGAARSWSSIAARRADDGAGSPWQRRNQRNRLRARCGASADERIASQAPRRRTAPTRVVLRELVQRVARLPPGARRRAPASPTPAARVRQARASPSAGRHCAHGGRRRCSRRRSRTGRGRARTRRCPRARRRAAGATSVTPRVPSRSAASRPGRAAPRRAAIAAAAFPPGRRADARARRRRRPTRARLPPARRSARGGPRPRGSSAAARRTATRRITQRDAALARSARRRTPPTRPRSATGRDGRGSPSARGRASGRARRERRGAPTESRPPESPSASAHLARHARRANCVRPRAASRPRRRVVAASGRLESPRLAVTVQPAVISLNLP